MAFHRVSAVVSVFWCSAVRLQSGVSSAPPAAETWLACKRVSNTITLQALATFVFLVERVWAGFLKLTDDSKATSEV